MGRKKLTEKRRITSVSFRPEVDKYIQLAEGASFSEKVNNLIIWCMTREKILHKQEMEYKDRIEELKSECQKLNEEILERKVFVEEMDTLATIFASKLNKYVSTDFRIGYKKMCIKTGGKKDGNQN
ncbi:MAG: hypothetical protein LIP16_02560 [Clostridium sp.]|nr:hypothetical protein [Clostridium sp.]